MTCPSDPPRTDMQVWDDEDAEVWHRIHGADVRIKAGGTQGGLSKPPEGEYGNQGPDPEP